MNLGSVFFGPFAAKTVKTKRRRFFAFSVFPLYSFANFKAARSLSQLSGFRTSEEFPTKPDHLHRPKSAAAGDPAPFAATIPFSAGFWVDDMAMTGGVTSLYSCSLTRSILPCLRRRLVSSHFSSHFRFFHCFHTSQYRPCVYSSTPFMPPGKAILAQARRGSSSASSSKFRDDEIASPADLQFEAPLKIVEYPDPILRAKNKRIETFDDNLKKLVDEMFDVMYRTDGIGLSAPQVGKNLQLMVFNPVGERGEGEEVVLVNPRINRYSKKLELYNEGCLSFPGINADVERPESVRIDAQDIKGERFSFHLNALPARIFQHEYDHLQGILFFDRMTGDVLESILADLQALEKKYEDRTGLPSPEKADALRKRKRTAAVGFGKPT